ncbi:MAG: c-type cytochrome [Blastocatellia bacterium]
MYKNTPDSLYFTRTLLLSSCLTGLLALTACNGDSANSAVTTSSTSTPAPAQPATAASATPATAVTTPAASPSVMPTVQIPAPGTTPPVAGTTPPQPGASPSGQKSSMSPVSLVGTKLMETPTPTPTPIPASTPQIVRENGKIVQQWQAPAEYRDMKNPVASGPKAAAIGKENYSQVCSFCHGDEGLGNGPQANLKGKQATNLTSEMVQANTDGELFYKVSNARLPHPKLQARFTDEQRWYIVSFLRTMKPGAPAKPKRK